MTHIDAPSPETSWFRAADLEAAAVRSARRTRRQRFVKALGFTGIAGLCVLAAWIGASTAGRDEIATWGTMGNALQVQLTASSCEEAAPSLPELELGTGMIAWAMEPPFAASSVPRPDWHASESPLADPSPYAGAVAPVSDEPTSAPDALSDPY